VALQIYTKLQRLTYLLSKNPANYVISSETYYFIDKHRSANNWESNTRPKYPVKSKIKLTTGS